QLVVLEPDNVPSAPPRSRVGAGARPHPASALIHLPSELHTGAAERHRCERLMSTTLGEAESCDDPADRAPEVGGRLKPLSGRWYSRISQRSVHSPRRYEAEVTTQGPEPTTSAPASDDVALVKAYLEGEAGAFDTLFSRYHGRVRGVCMRYVGDEHLAEDLVPEPFFNVVRSLHRVDDGFNYTDWIQRLAV